MLGLGGRESPQSEMGDSLELGDSPQSEMEPPAMASGMDHGMQSIKSSMQSIKSSMQSLPAAQSPLGKQEKRKQEKNQDAELDSVAMQSQRNPPGTLYTLLLFRNRAQDDPRHETSLMQFVTTVAQLCETVPKTVPIAIDLADLNTRNIPLLTAMLGVFDQITRKRTHSNLALLVDDARLATDLVCKPVGITSPSVLARIVAAIPRNVCRTLVFVTGQETWAWIPSLEICSPTTCVIWTGRDPYTGWDAFSCGIQSEAHPEWTGMDCDARQSAVEDAAKRAVASRSPMPLGGSSQSLMPLGVASRDLDSFPSQSMQGFQSLSREQLLSRSPPTPCLIGIESEQGIFHSNQDMGAFQGRREAQDPSPLQLQVSESKSRREASLKEMPNEAPNQNQSKSQKEISNEASNKALEAPTRPFDFDALGCLWDAFGCESEHWRLAALLTLEEMRREKHQLDLFSQSLMRWTRHLREQGGLVLVVGPAQGIWFF